MLSAPYAWQLLIATPAQHAVASSPAPCRGGSDTGRHVPVLLRGHSILGIFRIDAKSSSTKAGSH
eukprot:1159341-Pelagomonas_calceolata.AAC.10